MLDSHSGLWLILRMWNYLAKVVPLIGVCVGGGLWSSVGLDPFCGICDSSM